MDGVIFLMSHTDNRIIELLENVQVPIVTIGQEFLDENTIYYDEESAGRQLAEYAVSASFSSWITCGCSSTGGTGHLFGHAY